MGGELGDAAPDPDFVSHNDGHHVVAAPGAGHRGGALGTKSLEDFVPAMEAADVPSTDPRGGFARGFSRKMVVESNRAEKFGDRDPQAAGDSFNSGVTQVAVSIMKGVQERQQRGGLVTPAIE